MSAGDAAPRVSVVIAAYNVEAEISAAIASALRQTETAIEIIIVDDCSSDATVSEVLRQAQCDSRVKLIRMPQNQGPGAARNAAIDVARGDWIAVLDADDEFEPRRLERLCAAGSEEGADIVSDNILLCEPGHPPVPLLNPDHWPAPRLMDAHEFVCGNRGARHQGRVVYGFMKPVFRRAFLARERLRFPPVYFAEDYIFYLRCLVAGARWLVVPEPLYRYRVSAASLTGSYTPDQLAVVAALEGEVLSSSAIRGDRRLYREIRRHQAAARRAVPWMRFVIALRQRDYSSAAAAAFASRHDFMLLAPQVIAAFPRTCLRLARRGGL
ncbi:MAG: glycosyltransferase family 2 protein [Alphaproteobacteria bacterium]|nr:glycosyltransferase family 2 protein [Alphaproteobacteria bacterium]